MGMGCITTLLNWWDNGWGGLTKQLRNSFGIELIIKSEFEGQDPPQTVADMVRQYSMTTSEHWDMKELLNCTNFRQEELEEASAVYKSLKDDDFKGGPLAYQILSRSGIAPHIVRILCTTLRPQEDINFPVLMAIISTFDRGSLAERLSFLFSIFDYDGSGTLSLEEVTEVISISSKNEFTEQELDRVVEDIFAYADTNGDGEIQFVEFIEAFPLICKLLNIDDDDNDDFKENYSYYDWTESGSKTVKSEGCSTLPTTPTSPRKDSKETDPRRLSVRRDVSVGHSDILTSVGSSEGPFSPMSRLSRNSKNSGSSKQSNDDNLEPGETAMSTTSRSFTMRKSFMSPRDKSFVSRTVSHTQSWRKEHGIILGGAALASTAVLRLPDDLYETTSICDDPGSPLALRNTVRVWENPIESPQEQVADWKIQIDRDND